MKQVDIAKSLQKSQAFVSRFFSGIGGCSWKTAKKLSDLLGQSPSFWMDATPEQKQAVLNNGSSSNIEEAA
jgi:plasmid maintenance system antidote protein VapI